MRTIANPPRFASEIGLPAGAVLAARVPLCESPAMGGSHHHPGHAHQQGHGHSHGHAHGHGTPNGRAFAIAVFLNAGFVVAEVAAGLISGSMALIADAGHNLSDVLGLLIAWGASALAARPPSARFTYGFKSSSILAALANASLLWVALGVILIETLHRFADPVPVEGRTMIVVAALGIAVNALSALLFASGRKSDLNLRAAFVHLLGDAAVSAGVVIAGVLVLLTGERLIDPVTSLLITGFIAWGSWGLLRDSLKMGLLGVPDGIEHGEVAEFLGRQAGVTAVHDLHIWPMSTTETALTAHLVMPQGCPDDAFLHTLADEVSHRFGIDHPTIQIERSHTAACALESDDVV